VEQTDEETRIAIAPLPTLPIPKGNAGPSMLSHLLVSKFDDHQPFYRQVQIFKRQNLEIAEYSILATCKLDDVEPFAYLSKIFFIIPDFPANQLHTLLPGQK